MVSEDATANRIDVQRSAARSTPSVLARYSLRLPRDYDMSIIRDRVRSRGSALDRRDGLSLKVYAIRDTSQQDARVNEYAPFYIWETTSAMGHFHWGGGGFGGIITDFGRPSVDIWLPVAAAHGSVGPDDVSAFGLQIADLTEDLDTTDVAQDLAVRVAEWAVRPGVHRVVAGIDATRWRTVVAVTAAVGIDVPGTRYQVLHVSEPGSLSGASASTERS